MLIHSSLSFIEDFFVSILAIISWNGFVDGIRAKKAIKNNDKNDLTSRISLIDLISCKVKPDLTAIKH